MRIAGIVTTDRPDQQGDTIIQDGLDFSYFLSKGWYNDNHSSKTADILGYPERVQYFEKGSKLPDGSIASANCHWAEGYLLPDYEPSQRIWNLGQSLQKAGNGRSLGFSVEGKIKKRGGPGRKIIAKAEVRNVAITNCPVNTDTKMVTLAKSLHAATAEDTISEVLIDMIDRYGEPVVRDNFYFWKSGDCEIGLRKASDRCWEGYEPVPGKKPYSEDSCVKKADDDEDEKKAEKALSMTAAGGTGAGAILSPESLERDLKNTSYGKFGKSEALELIRARLGVNNETAERFYALHKSLVRAGIIR